MGYKVKDFSRDMTTMFGPTVKYLRPLGDAMLNKAVSKVNSYKKGGRVTGGKRGAAKMIKAHVGEFVLPIGVKPTKAQKSAVASKRRMK